MAGRSTRNKVRFQLEKTIQHLGGIQVHLKFADDLAQEGHPRLSAALPEIVAAVESLKETVIVLRDLI